MKANKKLSKIKGAQFYKVGDKVEAIKTNIGAWFDAEVIDIIPEEGCECGQNCRCTYKLLFEGEENDEIEVVDRKMNEIREVSFSSIAWDKLERGMKVVINYNIDRPKQWGYWYDYVIEDIQKRNQVYYLTGTLLIGYEGSMKRLAVQIDSDHVADILAIRPLVTIMEKESVGYETGIKPEYCKKCRNRPKVKCKTCCCCKCGVKCDFKLTIQCDECSNWYHTYCVSPPLEEPPAHEDWYCPECNNETHFARLEIQQRRLKQTRRVIKKSKPKTKTTAVKKVLKPPPKSAEVNCPSALRTILAKKDKETDTEKKEILKTHKIWEQIEQLFPDYSVIRVTVEVARKNTADGLISDSVKKLIDNDFVNKHLWEEAMKSVIFGKEAFLGAVKKLFTCSICCDLLCDPITLSCNHSFCIDCFFRALSVNIYKCCLCRVDIIHTKHFTVNENLRDVLKILFDTNASD